MFYQPML